MNPRAMIQTMISLASASLGLVAALVIAAAAYALAFAIAVPARSICDTSQPP